MSNDAVTKLTIWQVVIGLLGLIIACVAVAISLLTPEIRYSLGLEQKPKVTLNGSTTIATISALTPKSQSTSTQKIQVAPTATMTITPSIPTTALSSRSTQPPATLTTPCKSIPPNGLVLLWHGIYGSPNMESFIVGIGEIDTNNPNFGTFQMWIDPCLAEQIESSKGRSFWPKTPSTFCIRENISDIPVGGDKATIIMLCPNKGVASNLMDKCYRKGYGDLTSKCYFEL